MGETFLTDGHSTFNIMSGGTNEITNDYIHFEECFGIDKPLRMYIQARSHIDADVKMLNEETIFVSSVGHANTIKNSGFNYYCTI